MCRRASKRTASTTPLRTTKTEATLRAAAIVVTVVTVATAAEAEVEAEATAAEAEATAAVVEAMAAAETTTGTLAAVQAGLAVTVLTEPAVGPGLRTCTGFDGMPELPSVDLVLYCDTDRQDSTSGHLADYLIKRLTWEN